MNNLNVSKLPNITFYTGNYASTAANIIENRQYNNEEIPVFGTLLESRNYSSYWSNFRDDIFTETETNYENIGDIINSTISYMNKFKNNNIDISVNKNVLTINYDFEKDLDSNYENTSLIPARDFLNLMLNMNEMTFNKKNYYKNDPVELKEITYLKKKYPYRKTVTKYDVTTEDSRVITYDFSHQFVDYNYSELSYATYYTAYIYSEIVDDYGNVTYIKTDSTYTAYYITYSYMLNDINKFKDRVDMYFENNSNNLEENKGNLKTYFLNELDTRLMLTLNTKSLGSKNLFAYINFVGNYSNWFDNVITFEMNTENLVNGNKLARITPTEETFINIYANYTTDVCDESSKISSAHDYNLRHKEILANTQQFTISNPTCIKELDLSAQTDKILSLDLLSDYNKQINATTHELTNWLKNDQTNIEKLIIGNSTIDSNITTINGLSDMTALKEINIENCNKLKTSFNLKKINDLNIFKAKGSSIKSFVPKSGSNFSLVSLPKNLKTITLKNTNIDNLDYEISYNLLNVTFENVEGINTQNFVKTWVDELSTHNYTNKKGETLPIIYSGLINNTNLVGINWTNYEVEDLRKLAYIGLNKFSGTISIKGSLANGDLNRKDYMNLRNDFGDTLIKPTEQESETNEMKFEYNLSEDAYNKKVKLYGGTVSRTGEVKWGEMSNELIDIEFYDNIGGNNLIEYLLRNGSELEAIKNDSNFGYETELNELIYTDSSDDTSKNLNMGDIVIYKGNKLIFVYQQLRSVHNYIKVGKFILPNTIYNNIRIEFKDLL